MADGGKQVAISGEVLEAHLRQLRSSTDRDEVLELFIRLGGWVLFDPTLYLVKRDRLVGLIALDQGEIERNNVRQRRLALTGRSLVANAVRHGVLYLGPVPPRDPCASLSNPARSNLGLVAIPVRLGKRTVCLLLGHPRQAIDRELRDVMALLGDEASSALRRVLKARSEDANDFYELDEGELEEIIEADQPSVAAPPPPAPPPPPAARRTVLFPGDERREHLRCPLSIEVDHESPHNFFTGIMEDISEGGLFVATPAPAHIGERFAVTFSLPGLEQPITIDCEVRWVRDATLTPPRGQSGGGDDRGDGAGLPRPRPKDAGDDPALHPRAPADVAARVTRVLERYSWPSQLGCCCASYSVTTGSARIALGTTLAFGLQPLAQTGVGDGDDLRREEGGVLGAVDGDRRDGDPRAASGP